MHVQTDPMNGRLNKERGPLETQSGTEAISKRYFTRLCVSNLSCTVVLYTRVITRRCGYRSIRPLCTYMSFATYAAWNVRHECERS